MKVAPLLLLDLFAQEVVLRSRRAWCDGTEWRGRTIVRGLGFGVRHLPPGGSRLPISLGHSIAAPHPGSFSSCQAILAVALPQRLRLAVSLIPRTRCAAGENEPEEQFDTAESDGPLAHGS